MCSDQAHIRRLAQVNSNTLIVFIAPNCLCDYETLLHQNLRQHAVFPIAHMPAIIPLRTIGCRPLVYTYMLLRGRKEKQTIKMPITFDKNGRVFEKCTKCAIVICIVRSILVSCLIADVFILLT